MKVSEIVLTHEPDIVWIVALWLAIHGGDPAQEAVNLDETTLNMAAALSAHLAKTHGMSPLTNDSLQQGAARLGLQVAFHAAGAHEDFRNQPGRPVIYCFPISGGGRICITLPTPVAPVQQ